MVEIINNFKQDMQRIFHEDIHTTRCYYLIEECASHIGATTRSVCHLQRAIQYNIRYTIKTLKYMVARMVPDVRRIGATRYELNCTLMYHYMNHGEGQQYLTSEDPILTRLYLDYLTRAHIGNMSFDDNMTHLRFEISPIVIGQLDTIRINHVRNLVRRYEESTDREKIKFIYQGLCDIQRSSLISLNKPSPLGGVFGSVHYIDIMTHFPLFRDEIQKRIDNIERQRHDEHAARIAAIMNRRIRQLDLPSYRTPYPVKYGVDICFMSTEECPICYENTCDTYVDCKHAFCMGCIKQHVDRSNARQSRPICPMCRVDVKQVFSNEDRRRPEVVDLTA